MTLVLQHFDYDALVSVPMGKNLLVVWNLP